MLVGRVKQGEFRSEVTHRLVLASHQPVPGPSLTVKAKEGMPSAVRQKGSPLLNSASVASPTSQ